MELREAIKRENRLFEEISKPLNEAIRQFGAWRNDWQAEKQRWNEWQSILLEDRDLDQLKPTFAKTMGTIDTALEIVLSQLKSMLTVQEKAGNIQAKIFALTAELDSLMLAARPGVRDIISPPDVLFPICLSTRKRVVVRSAKRPGCGLMARQSVLCSTGVGSFFSRVSSLSPCASPSTETDRC